MTAGNQNTTTTPAPTEVPANTNQNTTVTTQNNLTMAATIANRNATAIGNLGTIGDTSTNIQANATVAAGLLMAN